MEDFTLPSVWASFKKWECCTPILPKFQTHLHNTKKEKKKIMQEMQKKGDGKERPIVCQTMGRRLGCPKLALAKKLLLPTHLFLHM
jgi:hypothetical protein